MTPGLRTATGLLKVLLVSVLDPGAKTNKAPTSWTFLANWGREKVYTYQSRSDQGKQKPPLPSSVLFPSTDDDLLKSLTLPS